MSVCIKSCLLNVLRAVILPLFVLGVVSAQSFGQDQELSVGLAQKETFDAINQARAQNGLYEFKANSILFGVAQQYAELMASRNITKETANSHSLDGRTSSERVQAAGYPSYASECIYVCEGGKPANMRADEFTRQLAQGAVASWLNSREGHRDAVLHGRDRDAGVGYVRVGDKHYFCFNPGQWSEETNHPPQLVVAGGGTFQPQPEPMPAPRGGLKTTDLAGEWDWTGFRSGFALIADGENLIWKDHTGIAGTYTLMKVAGEAATFRFDYGPRVKFTSRNVAEFVRGDGSPGVSLQRIGEAP